MHVDTLRAALLDLKLPAATLDFMAGSQKVELLYFDGCPNHSATRELVERVATELGVELEMRLVDVRSVQEAERLRFLGSPTVRVNGRDVEPEADAREAFVLACRVYPTDGGVSGQPAEEWIRAALSG